MPNRLPFRTLFCAVFCGVCISNALLECLYPCPGAFAAEWADIVPWVAGATLLFTLLCSLVYNGLQLSPGWEAAVVMFLSAGWEAILFAGVWFCYAFTEDSKLSLHGPELMRMAGEMAVMVGVLCWPGVAAIVVRRYGAARGWVGPSFLAMGVLLLFACYCVSRFAV